MAEETTTTTESTTETTTEVQDDNTQETVTTTVVSSEATVPAAEKQGEVVVDQNATAGVVGDTDQTPAVDHIEQAKRDGLANHAAAEASQPSTTTQQSETAAE